MVPLEGLEPPRLAATDFESATSTDSITRALYGAGEGIRTLDIHLGKVTLYP